MASVSSAGNAELRLEDHAASIALLRSGQNITEDMAMPDYWHNPRHLRHVSLRKDEADVHIDVHIPAGVGTDVDGRAGGTRSVETGAEFDYLPEDCSGAGVENEVIDCRG